MFGIWSWKLQSKGSGDMVDIFLLERWNRARELAGSVIRFFGYGVWELLVLGFLWEVLWGHSLSWWISPLHTIPLAARVQHYSDTSFWDVNYCRDHGRPAGFHCSRLPYGFHASNVNVKKEWGSGKSNSLLLDFALIQTDCQRIPGDGCSTYSVFGVSSFCQALLSSGFLCGVHSSRNCHLFQHAEIFASQSLGLRV